MAVTEVERYDGFEDYLGGKIDIFGEGFTVGGEREKEIHGFWIAKANACSCYLPRHATQLWDFMGGGT